MSNGLNVRWLLRRAIPYEARWRVRAARREVADVVSGVRLSDRKDDACGATQRLCTYTRPLACYRGQESRFVAKKRNIALALSRVDGVIVAPGETFSFWRCVGRPTSRAGFEAAAALKDGVLIVEVGGAICLASTILYNAGLLAGMAIDERWCHSVDTYGDARYFELGRDAAVEYAYRDLRMRNTWEVPLVLRARVTDDTVVAEAWSREAMALSVVIDVDEPQCGEGRMIVRGSRTITRDGVSRTVDLDVSAYRVGRAP